MKKRNPIDAQSGDDQSGDAQLRDTRKRLQDAYAKGFIDALKLAGVPYVPDTHAYDALINALSDRYARVYGGQSLDVRKALTAGQLYAAKSLDARLAVGSRQKPTGKP